VNHGLVCHKGPRPGGRSRITNGAEGSADTASTIPAARDSDRAAGLFLHSAPVIRWRTVSADDDAGIALDGPCRPELDPRLLQGYREFRSVARACTAGSA
jgi:hypothetical protein